MKTAKYTIQCTHPDTGETGCWVFTGESHKIPGSAVSPLFKDQVELYKWMEKNGWEDAKNGQWNHLVKKQSPFVSEIILGKDGCNTYIGKIANLLINRMNEVHEFINPQAFSVLEVNAKGEISCKAIQSTMRQAVSYMTPERVLVYSA